jgi:hypothetical protein
MSKTNRLARLALTGRVGGTACTVRRQARPVRAGVILQRLPAAPFPFFVQAQDGYPPIPRDFFL